MQETNKVNEEKHLEAVRQKEIESEQILEYLKFNVGLKSQRMEEELSKVLANETLEMNNEVKKEIVKCLQVSRGYTEYKVSEIAENTGFNRTRTKALVKFLLDNGLIRLETLEETTFIVPTEV